jgi:hypothetical protein
MPHGWVDGDDPLARFAEAHIEVFTTSEIWFSTDEPTVQ